MEDQRLDEIARSLASSTSRRRLLRGAIGAVFGGALGMAGVSRGAAQAGKALVCHRTGAGKHILIEVSSNAVPAHAGHGDLIDDTSCPEGESLDYATCACSGTSACEPAPDSETCAGQCGAIINNCGQTVDCGPCCTPDTTCPAGRCGFFDNGCGGTIECACTDGGICIDTTCCTPISMCPEDRCGVIDDGCGGAITCKCPIGDVCTGTTCCTPVSTCPAGRCGAIDDGCGGTIKCKCPNGEVCDGTTCCTPNTICPAGVCGTVGDGCGGTLECGCPAGQTCTGTTCCTPNTQCQPGVCGIFDDGCGGTYSCGCASDEVCESGACVCVPQPYEVTCAGRCGSTTNNCGQLVNCGSCGGGGGGCFVSGTMVTLANGTAKPIELVVAGDVVAGRDGRTNVVLGSILHELGDQPLYAFNGGTAFVSASHPFLTESGWKAIDPEAARAEVPGLQVDQLVVGDLLIAADGAPVPLRTMQSRAADPATTIYDLDVDGDNTYVAAGLVVHNKLYP